MSAARDKWVVGISPTDSTVAAARHTVRDRLDTVSLHLEAATEGEDPDGEQIHQLRVWSRRAVAALDLYREWMPRRRYEWVRKQLKRIRRAAGEARDCDVLMRRLKSRQRLAGNRHWLRTLQAEREEAQAAIVALRHELRHNHRLAKRVDALLDHVAADGDGPSRSFAAWARERLPIAVDAFFAAVPDDRTDQAALHRFRIRGKQLRYVMELLAGAFAEPFRTALYPAVETLQDRLGELNDLTTAKRRLEKKLQVDCAAREAATWRRLLARQSRELEQRGQAFWAWCTPARLSELRCAFARILAESSAGAPVSPPTPSVPGGDSRSQDRECRTWRAPTGRRHPRAHPARRTTPMPAPIVF